MRSKQELWISIIVIATVLLIPPTDSDDIEAKCTTCKEIVDAFKEGLKNTAKSGFGGGNTHWEEKSLGSYVTSETRFLEIIEGLCRTSSKESRCHSMVEHGEELLESWWFEDFSKNFKSRPPEEIDLLEWFCIKNIKVCCPKNTYGPKCEACTGGTETPCTGNGDCDGEGTRSGTGKCKCHGGYQGDLCDACKDGHYEAEKNETHITCLECHDSCQSTCWEGGPKGCDDCKEGWKWDDSEGCTDIDECQEDQTLCKDNEFCANNQGSYSCTACDAACATCLGTGSDQCVKCSEGYTMENNTCTDIDECAAEDKCKGEHEVSCTNTVGSYTCNCEEGYEQSGDGRCTPKPQEGPPETKKDKSEKEKSAKKAKKKTTSKKQKKDLADDGSDADDSQNASVDEESDDDSKESDGLKDEL
ncbi:cysteine-rich with EGF-like domain protein 2 isoform X2 [Lingula anatina]|uniref:protein disulfide-isomerase n=1 Tax=Lingula anatina TaxID=7574 RepID=A0A1S3J388_LINAN|nr:cysteine-rich with EGF-like domain protein 2 isoform X2 [Lingula anatina]|eukprot:XP_013404877.1 cysteine-rich with EGF-like domain protein 2 isoform X2 [Lingula anatina]